MRIDRNYLDQLILEALKKKKKEEETKEATGTGGGYGYTPALSLFSNDDVARSEYKKPKAKEVAEEEEYCDACDRVKSKCICPKKVEANEMTDSSSVGAYDANSFQDISMKGNTVKGQGRSWKKTQIPGGGFVNINKDCKTFPYCSQGNSKDKPVKVSKTPSAMFEAIKNVSLKTGLSEEQIKNILINHLGDNL